MNVYKYYKEGNKVFNAVTPPFNSTIKISILNNMFRQKYKYNIMDLEVIDDVMYVDFLVQTILAKNEQLYTEMEKAMMVNITNPLINTKLTETVTGNNTKTYDIEDLLASDTETSENNTIRDVNDMTQSVNKTGNHALTGKKNTFDNVSMQPITEDTTVITDNDTTIVEVSDNRTEVLAGNINKNDSLTKTGTESDVNSNNKVTEGYTNTDILKAYSDVIAIREFNVYDKCIEDVFEQLCIPLFDFSRE